MNLMRLPNLVLAAVLVLLPLEQAHCACGSPASQVARATAAAPACHAACCTAPAARPAEHHGCPDQDPRGCTCDHLAAVDLSVVLTASPPETLVMSFTTPLASDVIAPASVRSATLPALDVGSPPLPIDPGAHGLRAPPVSA